MRLNRLSYRTQSGRIRDLVIDLQVLPIRDWQWQPGFEPRRLALIPADVDRGGLPPLPASLEVLICEYRVTRQLSLRALPRLRELHCRRSRITELDLAGAPKLSVLDCAENQLTTLDLRHSPELWRLDCSRNRLSTLDLSQAPSLRRLDCTRNQLATLDLSQSRLSYLNCRRNQLTRLEIPPTLEDLDCRSNQITELQAAPNNRLELLRCDDNPLPSLDLQRLPSLRIICLTELRCFRS